MRFPTKIYSSCIWVAIPVGRVILHWYSCGADGRSWLPKFLGWVDYQILLTHGVPLRARGAPLLNAMTDLIHSQLRLGTNEKRTVAIIYKLCYGLSQVCNWLQTDHALFLKDSKLNQRGLEAQREMGNSCCRRRVIIIPAELAESNTNKIGKLISETIEEKWQLALIIDDYTSIHSKRRQKTDQLCHPKSMCPIVDKVFKNVKAIPRCSATTYHNWTGKGQFQTQHVNSQSAKVLLLPNHKKK